MILFHRSFDRRLVKRNRAVEKGIENVIKNRIWSVKGKTIHVECSVMLNYHMEIVEDESVTSIDLVTNFI